MNNNWWFTKHYQRHMTQSVFIPSMSECLLIIMKIWNIDLLNDESLTIIIYLKLWYLWILVCVFEGQGRCHPCNRNLKASNVYWVEGQAVFEEVDFHSRPLLHKRWSRERQTFGRVSRFSLNNIQLRYYDLLDIS